MMNSFSFSDLNVDVHHYAKEVVALMSSAEIERAADDTVFLDDRMPSWVQPMFKQMLMRTFEMEWRYAHASEPIPFAMQRVFCNVIVKRIMRVAGQLANSAISTIQTN